MPVTLKTGVMKYRKSDGTYSVMDALMQEPTQDQIGAIETAGQVQVTAVQNKGTEIINSLPNDYTEVEQDVSELKSAMNKSQITFEVGSWTDGKYLDTDGSLQNMSSGTVSDFIDVNGAKNVIITTYLRNGVSICKYDSDKNIVGYIRPSTASNWELLIYEYDTSDASFIRFTNCVQYKDIAAVNAPVLDNILAYDTQKEVRLDYLEKANENAFFPLNLVDWIDNAYVDGTGAQYSLNNYSVTGFIPTNGFNTFDLKTWLRSETRVCLYDANHIFLSAINGSSSSAEEITATMSNENAAYIRLSCLTERKEDAYIHAKLMPTLNELKTRKDNSFELSLDGELGIYINAGTGEADAFTSSPVYGTDFIKLNTDYPIVLHFPTAPRQFGNAGIAYYTDCKVFDRGVKYNGTQKDFVVPDKMAYCRITYFVENQSIDISIGTDKLAEVLNESETEQEKLTDTLYQTFLTFGVIGDSLASGECYSNNNGTQMHDLYHFSWGQFIARRYGGTCYNFSEGGMTTRSWFTNQEHGYALASDGNHTCEMYYIALGQNDYSKSGWGMAYLGTIEDIDVSDPDNNADTFYGNYAKIIQKMKIVQPKAKFFCLEIPQYASSVDTTKEAFNEAIHDISELFENVYVLTMDGWNIGRGYPWYNRRGGHFNAVAYNYMSRMITDLVNRYMYEHPAEFTQVEFIGTDWEWT